MAKFLQMFLLMVFTFSAQGQQEKMLFSDAVTQYLPNYKAKSDKAFRTNNLERANFLFDSLINHCLKGTYLDNFKVKNMKRKSVDLSEFSKPVYLITYASWLVPSEGEIPALNKLAEKHKDQMDFVLLFWDKYEAVKALSKKYNQFVTILYVNEGSNTHSAVVHNLKHSLGFPTSFLLSPKMEILDIRRGVSHPYGIAYKNSFDLNYKSISDGISLLMINGKNQVTHN